MVVSSLYDGLIFRHLMAKLSNIWVIQTIKHIRSDIKTNQIMIVNMLQNWSHMYSSHYMIIKYVSFKPIHYVINLNIVSFFKVFNEFDYVFISDVL